MAGFPSADLLHPRYWLVWLGIGFLTLVCAMPTRVQITLARLLGKLMLRYSKRHCRVARINIRLCYPDDSSQQHAEFLQQYLENYCLIIMQLPRIWWGNPKAYLAGNEIIGIANLDAPLSEGKGVIVLYSHCMALDFGAVALSSGRDMYGMYNPFKNPVVDWVHNRGRERFGGVMISRREGFRGLIKAIKSGAAVVYLCDEDFGAEGSVFAPFFGRPKSTLTMLSRIVRRTEAVVVPVYTYYDAHKRQFVTHIAQALSDYPEDDEVANATAVNAAIEKMVSHSPTQYLWKLKYFKTSVSGEDVYRKT